MGTWDKILAHFSARIDIVDKERRFSSGGRFLEVFAERYAVQGAYLPLPWGSHMEEAHAQILRNIPNQD